MKLIYMIDDNSQTGIQEKWVIKGQESTSITKGSTVQPTEL